MTQDKNQDKKRGTKEVIDTINQIYNGTYVNTIDQGQLYQAKAKRENK